MKRLYRSEKDNKIGGVCGGIGDVYNVDPTVIRLLTVLIGLVTGIIPVLITYIVAWIIIPAESVVKQMEKREG